MFAAFALSVISWGRSPRKWTKTCLWYLGTVSAYQLVFTFIYFSRIYIGEISLTTLAVLSIVESASSGISLYLLPLLLIQLLNREVTKRARAAASIPALILIGIAILLLFYSTQTLIILINSAFYIYIFAISFTVVLNRKKIARFSDSMVMIYFFGLNAGINIFFLLDILFFHSRLPGEIPGTLLAVPIFIVSWAILFIWWHLTRTRKSGTAAAEVSAEFIHVFDLTGREQEVMEHLLSGAASRKIAEKLFISTRTVDTHIYNIYRKCGVKSRFELLRLLKNF